MRNTVEPADWGVAHGSPTGVLACTRLVHRYPWSDEFTADQSPFRVMRKLNDVFKARGAALLRRDARARKVPAGSSDYSVTLINRMEPPHKCNVKLRPEPKYGMGLASVSWHADSSLQPHSTIAVCVRALCRQLVHHQQCRRSGPHMNARGRPTLQLPPDGRRARFLGLACGLVCQQHGAGRRRDAGHLPPAAQRPSLLHAQRFQPPPPPRRAGGQHMAVLLDPQGGCGEAGHMGLHPWAL